MDRVRIAQMRVACIQSTYRVTCKFERKNALFPSKPKLCRVAMAYTKMKGPWQVRRSHRTSGLEFELIEVIKPLPHNYWSQQNIRCWLVVISNFIPLQETTSLNPLKPVPTAAAVWNGHFCFLYPIVETIGDKWWQVGRWPYYPNIETVAFKLVYSVGSFLWLGIYIQ